jgi:hypothetical protein
MLQIRVAHHGHATPMRTRMNIWLKSTVALAAGLLAFSASAQITFYENDTSAAAPSAPWGRTQLWPQGFNDRALR